jgi:hypothetical protein
MPEPAARIRQCTDVWALKPAERYTHSVIGGSNSNLTRLFVAWIDLNSEQLYGWWMKQSRKALLDEIKPLLAKSSRLKKEIQEMRARSNAEVLRDRRVVGMTTTGAAQNQDLIRLVSSYLCCVPLHVTHSLCVLSAPTEDRDD